MDGPWKYQLHVGIAHLNWKPYIYLIDCFQEDMDLFFYVSLDSHKIVACFYFSICKLLFTDGLW
jgi:hypothetical protein